MKKIDLGQTISILANVGVLAGIIFLAFELQQNNELMAQQQRFNRLSVAIGTADLVIENPGVAALLSKGADGLDGLTATELQQEIALAGRIIQAQAWSFRELPRDELPITRWRVNAKREGWRLVWSQRNPDFDPDFVDFMERNVIDN